MYPTKLDNLITSKWELQWRLFACQHAKILEATYINWLAMVWSILLTWNRSSTFTQDWMVSSSSHVSTNRHSIVHNNNSTFVQLRFYKRLWNMKVHIKRFNIFIYLFSVILELSNYKIENIGGFFTLNLKMLGVRDWLRICYLQQYIIVGLHVINKKF